MRKCLSFKVMRFFAVIAVGLLVSLPAPAPAQVWTAISAGGSCTWHSTAYTSTGANTFAIPAGVTWVYAQLVAGGGGGGGVKSTSGTGANAGGGGGGGGYVEGILAGLTASTNLTVTIGGGGTAGANTGASGGAGTNSTIANSVPTTLMTAYGGGGGTGVSNNANYDPCREVMLVAAVHSRDHQVYPLQIMIKVELGVALTVQARQRVLY